jgi:hypothetical protein
VEKVVKQLEHLYRPQNRQPRENGYRSQGPVRRNEIGASGHQQSTYRRHQDNRQFQKQGGTRQNPNENQQQNTCPSCRGKARTCSFFINGYCPGQYLTCHICKVNGHLSYACDPSKQ